MSRWICTDPRLEPEIRDVVGAILPPQRPLRAAFMLRGATDAAVDDQAA